MFQASWKMWMVQALVVVLLTLAWCVAFNVMVERTVIKMIDGGVYGVWWSCGGKRHLEKECLDPGDRGGKVHNGKGLSFLDSMNSALGEEDDGDVPDLDMVESTKQGHTTLSEVHEQRDGLAMGSGSDGGRKRVTFMDVGVEKLGEVRAGDGVSSPIQFLW